MTDTIEKKENIGLKAGNHKGRPKGAKNRMSTEIKKAIFETFQALQEGDQGYLYAVAVDHPAVFCNLLAKLVPNEVRAEIGRPGDFDHLNDKELDAAIIDKCLELGISLGGERTETLHTEPDPVHEENPPGIPAGTTPSTDRQHAGESRAG